MATGKWSKQALRRSGTVSRELRRVDPEPREFIAIPVTRRERRLPVKSEPASAAPSSGVRRYRGRMIACAVLLLIAAPVGLWINYQSDHVLSRNAMVRGQLAEIGTRLDGVITRIEVDEGQRVTAGQILARMEDAHVRAEAQQAQAELDGLKRELDVERSAILHEERRLQNQLEEATANLGAAEGAVEAAESRADDARAFHNARNELLPTGAISGETVRDAKAKSRTADALARTAKAERAAARSAEQRARLDADGLAIREQRIGVLETGVLRAQAKLAAAQADLQGTLIRAPADGAVVRRIVEPGGSVEVGTPVMSLWIGDAVWIEAWLDEDDIADVKVGSTARVTLQSFPGREFVGVVEKIGLTTDFEMPPSEVPQPRFARMRGAPVVGVGIRLENPPAELLPGLSAAVGIRRSGH